MIDIAVRPVHISGNIAGNFDDADRMDLNIQGCCFTCIDFHIYLYIGNETISVEGESISAFFNLKTVITITIGCGQIRNSITDNNTSDQFTGNDIRNDAFHYAGVIIGSAVGFTTNQ